MRLVNVAIPLLVVSVLTASMLWRLDRPPVYPREVRSLDSAVINLDMGNYSVAASRLRRTLSLNPNNSLARELFRILKVLGLPARRIPVEDAIVRAKKLYREEEGSAYMNMILGELERRSGEASDSVASHLIANKINPSIPHNWYLLGLAYRQLKQHTNAKIAFAKAVELTPWHVYTYELAQQNLYFDRNQEALDWYRATSDAVAYRIDAVIGEIRSLIKLGRVTAALELTEILLVRLQSNSRIVNHVSKSTRLLSGTENFRFVGGFQTSDLIDYLTALQSILDSEKTETDRNQIIRSSDVRITGLLEFDFHNQAP